MKQFENPTSRVLSINIDDLHSPDCIPHTLSGVSRTRLRHRCVRSPLMAAATPA
ncbi:MAG: hypothetical protein ACKOEO_04985 [Planctomycetaceae bacterium]